jgi:D-alanyl-D-alanine dipeptidase
MVRARDLAPGIVEDMRYATANNFTGVRVPGYDAGRCWLLKPVAEALAKAAEIAEKSALQIVVHDCYRPVRATAAFVRWAEDPGEQSTKNTYYPNVAKSALFAQGYIGRFSSHSTGTAVDLSLQRNDGTPLDFGTRYDFFDPRSATAAKDISQEARVNRLKLKAIMEGAGFRNYAREWWHYSISVSGSSARDEPVRE